jgi:hypothetical protein
LEENVSRGPYREGKIICNDVKCHNLLSVKEIMFWAVNFVTGGQFITSEVFDGTLVLKNTCITLAEKCICKQHSNTLRTILLIHEHMLITLISEFNLYTRCVQYVISDELL